MTPRNCHLFVDFCKYTLAAFGSKDCLHQRVLDFYFCYGDIPKALLLPLIHQIVIFLIYTVETAKFGTAKFGKLQSSNPFQHDCLIRHINMCKINCQVRTPKVRKLQSSALYLGRTLQFFHIISAKKDELCSNFKGCASC